MAEWLPMTARQRPQRLPILRQHLHRWSQSRQSVRRYAAPQLVIAELCEVLDRQHPLRLPMLLHRWSQSRQSIRRCAAPQLIVAQLGEGLDWHQPPRLRCSICQIYASNQTRTVCKPWALHQARWQGGRTGGRSGGSQNQATCKCQAAYESGWWEAASLTYISAVQSIFQGSDGYALDRIFAQQTASSAAVVKHWLPQAANV